MCAEDGYRCMLCRPKDVKLPHLLAGALHRSSSTPTRSNSPGKIVYISVKKICFVNVVYGCQPIYVAIDQGFQDQIYVHSNRVFIKIPLKLLGYWEWPCLFSILASNCFNKHEATLVSMGPILHMLIPCTTKIGNTKQCRSQPTYTLKASIGEFIPHKNWDFFPQGKYEYCTRGRNKIYDIYFIIVWPKLNTLKI